MASADAARSHNRPLPLPSVVLLADTAKPVSDEAALLDRVVTLRASVHPALVSGLERCGAKRRSAGWYQLERATLDVAELLSVLTLVPAGALLLRRRGAEPLHAHQAWEALCSELGMPAAAELATGVGCGTVELTVTRNKVHVRVRPTGLSVCGVRLRLTTRWQLRVADAFDVLEEAPHMVVLDRSRGALASLRRVADTSVVATALVGAPALAQVTDAGITQHMEASGAVAAVAAAHRTRSVACEQSVADMAALFNAPSIARAGLRSYQAHFVGTYAASRGLVCALPPGSGKTVAAAAALAHHAERTGNEAPHRALVVAPRALLDQWSAELAAFHPSAEVVTAPHGATAVRRMVRELTTSQHPAVLLAALEDVAKTVDGLVAFNVDDLVVDEAAFLRRSSQRTGALWRLRRHAVRALPLTATPQRSSADEMGALIAFATNSPHLFAGAPLSGPGPEVSERVGPLVFGQADEAVVLPEATHRLVVVTPTAVERALLDLAAAHLRASSAAVSIAAADSTMASTEVASRRARLLAAVQLSRTAACDPSAVLAASVPDLTWHQLAATAVPSKRAWLAALTADRVPTLVFCDSPVAAEAVAGTLRHAGVAAAALSSKVPPARRAQVMARFPNELTVLVCTGVTRLGLNLQSARRVVHFDVPHAAGDLHQREGRARRIGGGPVEVVACVLDGSIDHQAAERLLGAPATADVFQVP